MTTEKVAYSVRETAEALGLHPNTVYELISEGKLPALRLGRKILVSRVELEKWVAGGCPCKVA